MNPCDGLELELPIAGHRWIFDLVPVPLCASFEAIETR